MINLKKNHISSAACTHLTITFVLSSHPVLQNTNSWQPVESTQSVCIYKLNSNYLQMSKNLSESDSSQSQSECNCLQKGRPLLSGEMIMIY